MAGLHFDRSFAGRPGIPVTVAPRVRRVTADNPGAMTLVGTNSYVVGNDPVVVIDPGPENEAHLTALMIAIDGADVSAIAVTHTHRDHSPLARALKAETGAPIVGAGPHSFARQAETGDASLDEAVDDAYAPDQVMDDGAVWRFGELVLEAVATPGHTMNHLCFALGGQDTLFSGDHVMAWSTSLVAPPEGSMNAYLESLQRLLTRPESIYLPGHGARLNDAKPYVEGLFAHRMEREAAILAALELDSLSISALVDLLYQGLDARLRPAAGLSVLAHLERLEGLGQVLRPVGNDGHWAAGPLAFDRSD